MTASDPTTSLRLQRSGCSVYVLTGQRELERVRGREEERIPVKAPRRRRWR